MLLSLVSTLAAAVSSTGLLAPTTISDPSLALSGHDGYASLIDTENTLEMGFYAQTQDFTVADRDIEVESGVSTLLSKVGRTQLADIDAANIARMYLNEGVELSDAMLDYYTKLKNGNINRYSEFIDNLIAEIGGALNKTDLEKAQMFQEKVGTMLDLKLSGGSFIDGPGSGATLDFKYKLMASNWPTVSERKRIGFSFFNHVLQKTDYPSSVKYRVWELAS